MLGVFIATAPVAAAAENPVDTHLRQLNRLLEQHPQVYEKLPDTTSLISFEGRYLVVHSFINGDLRFEGAAQIKDLSPDVYTYFGPTIPCQSNPPHKPPLNDGCWLQHWSAIEYGFQLGPGIRLKVHQDEEIAEWVRGIVEDLLRMLQAREMALR